MIVPICQGINCAALFVAGTLGQLQPPPIEAMPLSLTSYWLFDDTGQPVAWSGQADGDPGHYANMVHTDPAHAGKIGACIGEWVTMPYTTAVSFTWQGQRYDVACFDAFGLESYRQPFYHEGYGVWVVPVDVLSPVPLHGLVWEWEAAMIGVGEVD